MCKMPNRILEKTQAFFNKVTFSKRQTKSLLKANDKPKLGKSSSLNVIDFLNFFSADKLSRCPRLRLEADIFNVSLVIFRHNGSLKQGLIITRGNTIQTTKLSKSARNQQTVHSNLATNKNIPYRNNAFNSEIQKYQILIETARKP